MQIIGNLFSAYSIIEWSHSYPFVCHLSGFMKNGVGIMSLMYCLYKSARQEYNNAHVDCLK